VKEGYFVEPRASTGGKYFGRTFSVNTSGRMITKERPCGNHVTISLNEVSFKVFRRRSGKVPLVAVDSRDDFEDCDGFAFWLSSSSLTRVRLLLVLLVFADSLDADFALSRPSTQVVNCVKAVAASTKWQRPPTGCLSTAALMVSVDQSDFDYVLNKECDLLH